MAYDPKTGKFTEENTSVSSRVTGLMSKNNPLMQKARTRAAQASNRRGLMNSSMAVQAGESAAYDVAMPIASQEAGQAHESNLQGRQVQAQDVMQKRELGSREKMQRQDIGSRERVSKLDRQAQERIAKMNVAAHEREKAASLAAAFENSYSQMVATVMNNPDIPSSTRQGYMRHAAQARDSNLRLVEQMYGIELDWSTPSGAGSSSNAAANSAQNYQNQMAQYYAYNRY